MIEKLNSYLSDTSSKKDSLDFLSSVKSEVETLVQNVDKFTLNLCKDPASAHLRKVQTKPTSTIKEKKISGHFNEPIRFKTEEANFRETKHKHFEEDTFNTKFKKHMVNLEKAVFDSAQKVQIDRPRGSDRIGLVGSAEPKKKDKIKINAKRQTASGHKDDYTDYSDPENGSVQRSNEKLVMHNRDLQSQIDSLKTQQASMNSQMERLNKEMALLRHQNRALMNHLGLNESAINGQSSTFK